MLDNAFVSSHGLVSSLEAISEHEFKDFLGNILKTKKVKLSSIGFGGMHFADVPVEIFCGALGRQKMRVPGGGILKRFNILIDPVNHHIYFSRSELYDVEFGA